MDSNSAGRALHFTSRREMESRPGFDAECIITHENYGGIIGDYDLPKIEWVDCQLQRKQGRCNQNHGHGFLVRVKGEQAKEGYIGGDDLLVDFRSS